MLPFTDVDQSGSPAAQPGYPIASLIGTLPPR
jgi:hypothetical protein